MTKYDDPKQFIVNRNQKRFNAKAPFAAFAIRAVSRFMPRVSPPAFNIARYLATYYNSSSANGVVNPTEAQIKYVLCLTDEQFNAAVDELVATGWFSAARAANGRIEQYNVLFVDWMIENSGRLSYIKSSLNHAKADARYTRTESQLAKAIMAMATESIEPIYDDLGYQTSRDAGRTPPHLIPNGDRQLKHCHSVFFHHSLIQTGKPEVWAQLAAMDTLPEDWTTDPMTTEFTFKAINEKFLLEENYEAITEAVTAINSGGWWNATVHASPFDPAEDVLVMTPLHKFHATVWELDNAAGGKNTTNWEVAHGFHQESYAEGRADDPFVSLPPLGYHYIYALSSYKTCEYLIVGQTTQTLERRENQHFYSATNDEANEEVMRIVRDPEDFLVIEQLATVHYSVCSEQEMSAANAMLTIGHKLKNRILDPVENERTIKLDSRFTQVDRKSKPGERRRQEAIRRGELRVALAKGRKKILFKVDHLPPVSNRATEISEAAIPEESRELSGVDMYSSGSSLPAQQREHHPPDLALSG